MGFRKESGWVLLIASIALMVRVGERVKLVGSEKEQVVLAVSKSATIEERVADLERRVTELEKKPVSKKSKAVTTSKAKESFVQLSSGSGKNNNWAAVSGTEFWLDTSLYGSKVEVSWQGWLESSGNQLKYARLYDLTNHRAVDYSEVLVSGSGKASFYSKPMAIWRGQNQYRIEVKSPAYEQVTVSSARLRIVAR